MSGLKILAIRPRTNCHPNFLKNLNPGEFYSFYSKTRFYKNTTVYASNEDEVVAVVLDISGPENLYNIKTRNGHPIEISVSAIAGKNGTGKSTLMELLFACIYVSSTVRKIMKPNEDFLNSGEVSAQKIIKQLTEVLKSQNDDLTTLGDAYELAMAGNKKMRFKELIFQLDNIRSVIDSTNKTIEVFNGKLMEISNERAEIARTRNELSAELYYQLDDEVYRLIVDKDINSEGIELSIIPKFDLLKPTLDPYVPEVIVFDRERFSKSFFYTVAVNYSHYALNSNHIGDWISLLFHKNDGYTTPAVINPMRTDGYFNINTELSLAKYRLLSNLLVRQLHQEERKPIFLTDHQYVKSIVFTLDKHKVKKPKLVIDSFGLQGEKEDVQFLKAILRAFLGDGEMYEKALNSEFPLKEILLNYILHKANDISKYDGFQGYKFFKEGEADPNELMMERLKTESSHMTYKLNQAINFLRYLLKAEKGHEFEISNSEMKSGKPIKRHFTLQELLDWIPNLPTQQIIEFIPPSIFNVEIEMSGSETHPVFFHDLSSGEQQMIHSIQSVIYHINNLISAQKSDFNRVTYNHINLVFDEIELYFHPEYQRKFLDELLTALKDLHCDKEHCINSINMMFLTHSPFILSDVPSDRVMRLIVDDNEKHSVPSTPEKQTFASNINVLLADSFFLKGTLMGRYAERSINALIDSIAIRGDVSDDEDSLLKLIGDSYLRSSIDYFIKNQNDKNKDN